MNRLLKLVWMFSFLGLGYLVVIHPAELLWKISPLASLGWLMMIGIGIYLELVLQERYPWLCPR